MRLFLTFCFLLIGVARASNVPSVVATPRGYVTVTPAYVPDSDTERPLWIRFDNKGVVTSFGFDEPSPK